MDLHGEPTSHLIMSRSWQDFAKIMGVVSFELYFRFVYILLRFVSYEIVMVFFLILFV